MSPSRRGYQPQPQQILARWSDPLRFDYQASGTQIRTVLETYRDTLFPGRSEVPETLVLAKDDHAEEIVGIVRDVFGAGNEFAKKITYKVG